MEPPPPFFHHPPRYVPLTLPPPPQSFPDDHNFYLPSPPPPPPPYHPLPLSHLPPPPFNPHPSHFDYRRYSPPRVRVSREPLDFDPRFRFQDNYSQELNHRVDFHTGYRHDNDFNTGYGQDSRNYNYVPVYRENDTLGNSFISSDLGSSRRGHHIYGSNSNSNNISVGARNENFNSPKNQVQKKSALHRVQFNEYRGRNNKNEDLRVHLGTKGSNRMNEEGKRSPMELNVSFKSNSLVAEAIEFGHNTKFAPKKRKMLLKKAMGERVNLKKKVVRPMSCMSIPEREGSSEPTKKHRLLKSVVVSPSLDEADTKLNDNNASASPKVVDKCPPAVVSVDEDAYVDIGGTPIHDVKRKRSSSPPSVKRITIDECAVSGDVLDDSHAFRSCEKTSLEEISYVHNSVTFPEKTDVREDNADLCDSSSDGHGKNPVSITISNNNIVDSVSETDKAIVVPESFASGIMTLDEENKWKLVTPSTADMFLKEVSEATIVDTTALSSPSKDYIIKEHHIEVSGTEKETSSQFEEDDSVSAGTFTSGAELPVNIDGGWTQLEDRDVSSRFNTFSSVRSSPCSESATLLFEDVGQGASFDDKNLTKGDLIEDYLHGEKGSFRNIDYTGNRSDGEEIEQGRLGTESFEHRSPRDNDIDTYEIPPVSEFESEKVSYSGFEETLSVITESQMINTETELGQISEGMDWEVLSNQEEKPSSEGPPLEYSLPTLPSTGASENLGHAVSTAMLINNILPDPLQKRKKSSYFDQCKVMNGTGPLNSNFVNSLNVATSKNLFPTAAPRVISNQDDKPSAESPSLTYPAPTLPNNSINKNSGRAIGTVNPGNSKLVDSVDVGINTSKNLLPPAVPRVFRLNPSVTKIPPTSQNLKQRTWQRSSNPSIPSIPAKHTYPSSVYRRAQSATVARNVPSVAYVRQGNSLVRKSTPTSGTPKVTHALGSSGSSLNPPSIDQTKKSTGNDSKVKISSLQNTSLERPNTPPLPSSTKISKNRNISLGSGSSMSLVDPLRNVCSETEVDPLKLVENVQLKDSSCISEFSASQEFHAGQNDSSESQGIIDGNLAPTNKKNLVYLKRKANQLVAATSPPQIADKTETLYSSGYFKRRKHQLVRKLLGTGPKIGIPDENLNCQAKSASQIIASSFQRRSGKGFEKTCKPSLVWTLHDAEPLKRETSLLSQVWPRLLPWKRATHRKQFAYNQALAAKNGSVSLTRNLLLSRQRKTIYKRSWRGLSLRKSKILSVDGSSLKWSKSIDKNCKKANEEATLAVAAVEKKKREKDVATSVTARTKSRNHTIRERIYRVGASRYKMDPTRRTLQRISDDESSCSSAVQSGKGVKKTSVPRRLVIGNQEYVRIGNGNQLVRDPKKRTRILASEKVRWSLHTARLSLLKKKKYCQFFTKYGNCNKQGGKCPYIHDPEKIAVCTKFLRGACSDSNCKLTHKVIPERMEDCSYFLQGLCSNEVCPYRHVNVNPNASTCEGFRRGYCADGNECRKKHSYVCPVYESTGTCPQGLECKLHHPKNQNKGKKRKTFREKNNGQGRYFGSKHVSAFDTKVLASNKNLAQDDEDNMFFQEGKFADFIPLDVSDEEEGVESVDYALEQKSSRGSHLVKVDINDLVKPIGLMKRKMIKESSPTV